MEMNAITSRHPHTSTISFYSPQRLRDAGGILQLPSHPICAPKFSPGVAGTEPPLSARRARGPLGLVVSPLLRRRRRRIGGGGTTRPLSQWPPSRAATSGPAEAQGDRRCPGNGPGRPWRRGGPRAEGSLRGCVRRGRFFWGGRLPTPSSSSSSSSAERGASRVASDRSRRWRGAG